MVATKNFRWRIVVLLFFATTINYIDRQVIGILKPFIADDLGWSETDYGMIVSAFQVAYAIGLLTTGYILDRFGTKIGYAVAIVVWSIGGMAHAATRNALGFATARFMLGLGESANFPAAVKAVAEWFPKKKRALATGWFNAGSTVGAIIGPVIVTVIYIRFNWQWTFIVTGLLGFVWLIFWWVGYKLPAQQKNLSRQEFDYIHSDQDENNESLPWKKPFWYKTTFIICIARFITDWVWWFFLFWTPDYLEKTHGVDIKDIVLPMIVIYSLAAFGGIWGGWMSSYFVKRKSVDYARKTTILICALSVLPLISVPWLNDIWPAVGLIALAAAAHQAWASNIFTVVSDIYPKNAVGSMTGLAGFCGSMGGVIAASAVGFILDITNSYLLIFSVAGSAYVFAWLFLKLGIKRIEPIKINLE
jgi:MFS transporter, ACS family, hexuronate transporter